MKKDSFRKRYLYKLLSNLIGFGASFAVASVVPRSLGPSLYGNFTFISNFFRQFVGLFDMSTSQAFYIKLSQRQSDHGLVKFYWTFVALTSVVTIFFVGFILSIGFKEMLWPNQQVKYIWMGLIWGLFTWYFQILEKMLDGYGLTVKAQEFSIIQKVIKVLLILSLFFLKWLTLTTFFVYHYILFAFLYVYWVRLLKRNGIALFPRITLSIADIKKYFKEFYDYSYPLVMFSFAGFIFGVLDIWFLEKFAGSVQQGFYGFAFQIGSICFLFTASMTPLLLREFSISFEEGDLGKMKENFERYIPMFYTITAIFAIFVSLQSQKIGVLIGGKEFTGATIAIALMALSPLNKTYGQLSTSLLYATGQTKLHRNIGFFQMPITLCVSYFMLAPKDMYGLNLGATGLAIKIMVAQTLSVYIRLWFNTRYLGLSYKKFVLHNISTICIIGILAACSIYVSDYYLAGNILLAFLLSGVIYLFVVSVGIYSFPWVVSMKRDELKEKVLLILKQLKFGTSGS